MELFDYLGMPIGAVKIGRKFPAKDINICIDAGSTGTRSILFQSKDIEEMSLEQEILEIETPIVQVRRKIPSSIRTGKKIEDNLECEVKLPGGDSYHFVKGNMRAVLSQKGEAMVSSESKIDQELLYQTILFQMGLHIMLEDMKTSTEAEVYNVSLTLALPPEDIVDDKLDNLSQKLSGISVISFPRIKKSYKINVHNIEPYAEPEAAAYYYIVRKSDEQGAENIVFLDCGGRSKGACIEKDNIIVQASTSTSFGGGEKMLKNLAQTIAETYSITIPNVETVRAALMTGKINVGTNVIDITEDIQYVKEELASECVDTIHAILDKNGTKLEEIQRIVCTGRTFTPTKDVDGKVISESLVVEIKNQMSSSGVTIIIEYFSDPNPIVRGLYCHAIMAIAESEGIIS